MKMTKIAEYARVPYETHGHEAEVKAARKARQSDEAGDSAGAATWRAIREAISELRGAPES